MTISIFIPVYNGQSYLPRTLNSVLRQSYSDLEILCVDDSSTDESYALLQEYAERDHRIQLFQKPNGGSVPPSWNFVIPHLRGEFTLYMSQDDLLESDTIEGLVNRQRESGADAVIPHEIHYVEGLALEEMHHLKGVGGDVTPVITGKEAFRLMINYSISGRALWPTRVIKQIGMPLDTYNDDEYAQRRWILECDKVAFSEAVFFYIRNNPRSITERHSAKTYEEVLTNAKLLQLAEMTLQEDPSFVQDLANAYFYRLYYRMINFRQRKSEYSVHERKRIITVFRKAYVILHSKSTLKNWKFRLGSWSFFSMNWVVWYKCLQYKRKNILLPFDLD